MRVDSKFFLFGLLMLGGSAGLSYATGNWSSVLSGAYGADPAVKDQAIQAVGLQGLGSLVTLASGAIGLLYKYFQDGKLQNVVDPIKNIISGPRDAKSVILLAEDLIGGLVKNAGLEGGDQVETAALAVLMVSRTIKGDQAGASKVVELAAAFRADQKKTGI
jgi:hypothetical protein